MRATRPRRFAGLEKLEPRCLLAADVYINEFMASNATTLDDGFGEDPDWIELHNAGDSTADLGGYKLSDTIEQPARWTVPAGTLLEPHEYLVIFASGEDTVDPAGNLHTNFSLDRGGDKLVLSDRDGNVVSQFGTTLVDYPRQFADISYGREGFGRFDSNHEPIRIRSDRTSTVVSEIEVVDLPGTVTDVNVTLNIEHGWNADLNVFLIAPGGTRVELFTGVGRSLDNFTQTTLDDDAGQSITAGTAPFTGAFRPEGSLAVLNGSQPQGTWTLEVNDTFAAEGGELIDWTLNFETTETPTQSRLGYMQVPSPGGPNFDVKSTFVADTSFSVKRGFFTEPFDVEVSTESQGATIYVSFDGSEPAPDNPTAVAYTEPLRITTTTTLRAAAYRDDALPTNVDTQTYLFLDDVLTQAAEQPGLPNQWAGNSTIPADYEMDPEVVNDERYASRMVDALAALPTVSLVMSGDDWFDDDVGIYANSQEAGFAWERSASVEMFGFDHGQTIQLDAGVRMQGNASRAPSRPKHNMRLAFRSQYGDSRLEFPLFENTDIQSFNSIVLRGGNGDSWINPTVFHRGSYIRDQWHRDMQLKMGHDTAVQGYVHLYLNGLYWGLFHAFERVESDFMAEHFGGEPDDYDVIKDIRNTGGRLEAVNGTTDAWLEMVRRSEQDQTVQENYEAVGELLDLENFVDYLLLNFYSGNKDWDRSNWRAGRKREEGSKFMMFSWDAERTDLNTSSNASDASINFDVTGTTNRNYPTYIHQQLVANPEYRLFFADRMQKHFFNGGALTPSEASASWNARADEIRLPILAESARWGDTHVRTPRTPQTWEDHLASMNQNWFPTRTDVVVEQLRRRELFPEVAAPGFSEYSQTISSSIQLELTSENESPIFVTTDGSDPRIVGGAVTETAERYTTPLEISPGTTVRARILVDGNWSPLVEANFESGRLFGDIDNDGVTDVRDVDAVCRSAWADQQALAFDLNQDAIVDLADVTLLMEQAFASGAGDTNADWLFDSSDLVRAFALGQFEDAAPLNTLWSGGDWNCDGDFNTTDLVTAFQAGLFAAAASPASHVTVRAAWIDLAAASEFQQVEPFAPATVLSRQGASNGPTDDRLTPKHQVPRKLEHQHLTPLHTRSEPTPIDQYFAQQVAEDSFSQVLDELCVSMGTTKG